MRELKRGSSSKGAQAREQKRGSSSEGALARKQESKKARRQAGEQALGRHSVGAMPQRGLLVF